MPLHGMAHITGGGLPENLPRCLPPGASAFVDLATWVRPHLFQWLKEEGNIPERDLWHTFNLGVGFCLVVDNQAVDDVLQLCREEGLKAWPMGLIQQAQRTNENHVLGLPD